MSFIDRHICAPSHRPLITCPLITLTGGRRAGHASATQGVARPARPASCEFGLTHHPVDSDRLRAHGAYDDGVELETR